MNPCSQRTILHPTTHKLSHFILHKEVIKTVKYLTFNCFFHNTMYYWRLIWRIELQNCFLARWIFLIWKIMRNISLHIGYKLKQHKSSYIYFFVAWHLIITMSVTLYYTYNKLLKNVFNKIFSGMTYWLFIHFKKSGWEKTIFFPMLLHTSSFTPTLKHSIHCSSKSEADHWNSVQRLVGIITREKLLSGNPLLKS